MKWLIGLVVLLAACTSDPSVIGQPEPGQILPEKLQMTLQLTSPAFAQHAQIPEQFTCEGADVNPQLDISGVPDNAQSLVLIMDDPDAPPKVWEHWTLINIAPTTTTIAQDSVPQGAIQLMNDFARVQWGGPCPPAGPAHKYQFKLYALDTTLSLDSSARKADVEEAMRDHIIEQTVLVGTFQR